ncbi:MFS general substrate transporter [Setomelanomma holmii]|uniref:MFS general substrate transporter n=1 Tax=Setomelanomma holmii TaxID=210430 RepID=A0A9P4HHD4_9PLEO|nr:MFS general substrate transporter [Setomelanomma holmii]
MPVDGLGRPTWKKAMNVCSLFLVCIISPSTSSVFSRAIPDMMAEFKTTDQYVSSFVLSVYMLGYAFELYGHTPLYHICTVLFTLCTWRCGAMHSVSELAILLFLAGVGGGSVFAEVLSSVADMTVKKRRGAIPTAGSYINDAWGWRWIFHIIAILGGCATFLSMICLWETSESALIRRKTKQIRGKTGNPNHRSQLEVATGLAKLAIFLQAMSMPLRLMLSSSILLTSLIITIGYGWIYILYTTLPTTFSVTYRWAPKEIGLAYLGTTVGNFIGMVAAGGLSDGIVKRRAARGDSRPAIQLLPMIFFWPLVSVGLLAFVGTGIIVVGAMSAIFFTSTYILNAYPSHSASGIAAASVLRSLIRGFAPLFANKLYHNLYAGSAFSLLAFVALVCAPEPWLFYRYGKR